MTTAAADVDSTAPKGSAAANMQSAKPGQRTAGRAAHVTQRLLRHTTRVLRRRRHLVLRRGCLILRSGGNTLRCLLQRLRSSAGSGCDTSGGILRGALCLLRRFGCANACRRRRGFNYNYGAMRIEIR